MLSAAGLLRGGIRGWVSTSLGTLLLYGGLVALQSHAAATKLINGEFGMHGSRNPDPASNPEPVSLPMKGTCVSPGIVAPI